MLDYFNFFKNSELFKGLKDDELEWLMGYFKLETFEPGQIIVEEGSAPQSFYIIVEGHIEVWKDYNTPLQDVIAIRGPGASFGEMALIDDLPRSATVIAKDKVTVFSQSKEAFNQVLRERSTLALIILRSFSAMVRQSNETFINGLREKNEKLALAYDELQKAQQEMIRNERLTAIGKFASMIVHDIRNPISIMRGYAEMISIHANEAERVQGMAAKIVAEADRLNRLAEEILDFSKGEIQLNLSPVILGHLIQKLKETFEPSLKARDIKWLERIEFNEHILIDQDRFFRVLVNIIDNSRKAMKKGGILTLRAYPLADMAVLEILDTGVGMDEETRKRLFDPFYSKQSGGTGLGMFIVANIIEAHHGQIFVESELNKGTKITIKLPISQ
jgi:signal transduction histidine kinase